MHHYLTISVALHVILRAIPQKVSPHIDGTMLPQLSDSFSAVESDCGTSSHGRSSE